MMFRVGGYIPSDTDLNCSTFDTCSDKLIKLASKDQSKLHIIPEFTPISNQGAIGSCVANATGDCLEILKGLEDSNKVEQVSRLFIYYNARSYTNDTKKDNGCFIHHALDSLTKLGVCREDIWQYDTGKVFTQPSLEAYREGNDNTFTDFYQIKSKNEQKLADIETAVRANHPVIFGTLVGPEFQAYRGDAKVFDPPTFSLGGHAMLVVGVRINDSGVREFCLRNSWGEGWGNQGHCWVSSKYLSWNQTQDLFVPTRMNDFLV